MEVAVLPPGRYVVAVSGGVDSMVLLDILHQQKDVDIIAAHVNHGIRPDGEKDAELVVKFCMSHNISYELKELHLGGNVSEAGARKARYSFLQKCRKENNAAAIVTAHHEDDLVETAFINILRGTSWRGIAPFVREDILRPLIGVRKKALIAYAKNHNINWREDSTNADQRYLRNYVRLSLLPFLEQRNPKWREKFLRLIRKQQVLRRTIDSELGSHVTWLAKSLAAGVKAKRYDWIMLPDDLAYELFQMVCRKRIGHSLVKSQVKLALVFIKVAKPGKVMHLTKKWQLRVTLKELIVEPRPLVVN